MGNEIYLQGKYTISQEPAYNIHTLYDTPEGLSEIQRRVVRLTGIH